MSVRHQYVGAVAVSDTASLREARGKLHAAARLLGLDEFDAVRIAGAACEAGRALIEAGCDVEVALRLSPSGLRVSLRGAPDAARESAAGAALMRGFDRVQHEGTDSWHADCAFRRGWAGAADATVARAQALLAEKSREALMREVQAQNAQLARHRDELEARVSQRTAELETALTSAEQANRAKTLFLSSMSHELRTPLNGVLGYAELLQHEADLAAEHREKLTGIESCAQHLLGLISDLLDFSKIESGRMEFEFAEVDVGALVTSVVDIVRSRVDAVSVELTLDNAVDGDRLFITDESKLRQVLVNLMGNSAKFTAAGRISLQIREVGDIGIVFTVTDTGPGIGESELETLFEPFRQGKAGLLSGGTGLGLSITKRIVEDMDGAIAVRSELGVGTTFEVTLPRVPARAERRVQRFEVSVATPAELRTVCETANARAHELVANSGETGEASMTRLVFDVSKATLREPFAEGIDALVEARDIEALRYLAETMATMGGDLDALVEPAPEQRRVAAT